MLKIAWLGEVGKRVLHIQKDGVWYPYNHPQVRAYYKPDYPIEGGSKGFASMQQCLKMGAEFVKTEDVEEESKGEDVA